MKLLTHPDNTAYFTVWSNQGRMYACGSPHLRSFVDDEGPQGLRRLLEGERPHGESQHAGSKPALLQVFKRPGDAFGDNMLDVISLRKVLRSAEYVRRVCKKWQKGEGDDVPEHMRSYGDKWFDLG